jgi:capsular exopolysaccharide synthesis family protein
MSDPVTSSRPAGLASSAHGAPSPASHGSQGHHHAAFTPESDVHILDRVAVLYRYRRIAGAVFVLSAAAMMIQGYTSVQLFQAQAQVMIEDERATAVPGLNGAETMFYEDPEPYYNTQYRILKGRDLTRRVIKKLNLASVPEFNGTAEPPSTPATLVRDGRDWLVNLLGPSRKEATEPPKIDETADESALVSSFIARVEVLPIRGSRLVNVSFTARDPKFAALAVNALVDEYVEQNLQVKVQASQNMLDWLAKELEKQQQKVKESEQALSDYRDRQNALSLDDKQNIVTQRLTQLNDAMIRARTTKAQKEALYNQVRSMAASTSPDAIPTIAQNPTIQALKAKVTDLAQQRAQLSEKFGDKWPAVQSVNANLQEARNQLEAETSKALQSIKNDYETAVLEERTLAGNLEAAKGDAQDLSRKSVSYNVMEREAKSNRQVYESLLAREKELSVASNSRANNVRVVDRAEVPTVPLSPGGRRTWFLALAVGFVLAVGVAFGLDYMNDTIKTPEDVTRRLKLPFLGLVPSVRGDKHPVLTSSNVPHDFGEAFRSLRTSLIGRYSGDGTKIIVVTSAQPLEGKTTTAANIAMALAYGGSRVLLVDADMRRPGLHRPLRLTNERGLSQVLIGQARVRDVIQRTVDPNLLAITAGRTPPNPSELLASERMKTLLSNLSHGPFDWIVIDTPPVLAVTDAVILAPHVSGVTFVVGAEMTRRRLAERALETIISSHPKVTAVVLNRVDFARNKYYYSRYYGHQYKNYYAQAV